MKMFILILFPFFSAHAATEWGCYSPDKTLEKRNIFLKLNAKNGLYSAVFTRQFADSSIEQPVRTFIVAENLHCTFAAVDARIFSCWSNPWETGETQNSNFTSTRTQETWVEPVTGVITVQDQFEIRGHSPNTEAEKNTSNPYVSIYGEFKIALLPYECKAQ